MEAMKKVVILMMKVMKKVACLGMGMIMVPTAVMMEVSGMWYVLTLFLFLTWMVAQYEMGSIV